MVKDHNGKEFKSVKKMCDFYDIPVSVYTERIQRSRWNKKKALETPCSNEHQIKDHKGKIFPTKTKMCEAYGISISCFRYREKAGWPLKKILTTPSMASHNELQADKKQKENDKYDKVIEVVEKLSNKVDNMEKQLRTDALQRITYWIGKLENLKLIQMELSLLLT